MDEIAPGIHHWTAHHEGIGMTVHSFALVVDGSVSLVDPMLPAEGIDAFRGGLEPQRILLTNRHHLRQSDRFVAEFGCEVLCHEAGLHEFGDGPDVQPFRFGDEVAPGITALEVGALTPEDTVFRLSAGPGALLFADGLIRGRDGALAFVPDSLMGDDPEGVKAGLRASLRRLVDEDFDALLFAHGDPMPTGGHAALRAFAG